MDNSYKKIQFGGWTGRSFAEVREKVYRFLDDMVYETLAEFEDEDEPTDKELSELEEDEPEGEEIKDD